MATFLKVKKKEKNLFANSTDPTLKRHLNDLKILHLKKCVFYILAICCTSCSPELSEFYKNLPPLNFPPLQETCQEYFHTTKMRIIILFSLFAISMCKNRMDIKPSLQHYTLLLPEQVFCISCLE